MMKKNQRRLYKRYKHQSLNQHLLQLLKNPYNKQTEAKLITKHTLEDFPTTPMRMLFKLTSLNVVLSTVSTC